MYVFTFDYPIVSIRARWRQEKITNSLLILLALLALWDFTDFNYHGLCSN